MYDRMKTEIPSTEPKSRRYIREWKRKDYAENGDKIKAKNKAYYYKKKCGLSSEDMKIYDIHLPLVAKVMDNLNKLKDVKPELIELVLQKYTNIQENSNMMTSTQVISNGGHACGPVMEPRSRRCTYCPPCSLKSLLPPNL
jgi:hypothetical protein